MLLLLWLLLPVGLGSAGGGTSSDWTYDSQDKWGLTAAACDGERQSPMPLWSYETKQTKPPKLYFSPGLKHGGVLAVNTGHTLKLTLTGRGGAPMVKMVSARAPLSGAYALDGLHFHWNSPAGGKGSEHVLPSGAAEVEAHFVFYNLKYSGVAEALGKADGLAVIGVLADSCSCSRPGPEVPTLGLERRLRLLARPGSQVKLPADLRGFRPLLVRALRSYFSYEGSLTTPPCSPVVTWLVSSTKVNISSQFLRRLRSQLYQDAGGSEPIVNNWRWQQPRRGRKVVLRKAP